MIRYMPLAYFVIVENIMDEKLYIKELKRLDKILYSFLGEYIDSGFINNRRSI